MSRLLSAIISSVTLVGLSLISYGFGDSTCTIETWISSFILPLWSLFTVSLWYDTGRFIWSNTFEIDSKNSDISITKRAFIFTMWMSVVFTYIVWVHISLFAIPMLFVLPFIGYFLRDLLFQDWTIKPIFTKEQGLTILIWALSSYLIYWLLTIAWILFRVWYCDMTSDGTMYFIQH